MALEYGAIAFETYECKMTLPNELVFMFIKIKILISAFTNKLGVEVIFT